MDFEKIFGAELAGEVKSALEANENIRLIDVTDGEYITKEQYDADIEKAKEEAAKVPNGDIEDMESENETLKKELSALKFSAAYDLKLATAGAKNAKALKGLIDESKLGFDEDGAFIGFDEQLGAVKSENPWLFEVPGAGAVKHGAGTESMDGVTKAFLERNEGLEL